MKRIIFILTAFLLCLGNTSHARPGLTITKDIAIQYLSEDVRRFERHVNVNVNRELKTHEFDALVSFTFNCGYRVTGDLKSYINLNLTDKVKEKLSLYHHAGKKDLPGIIRRRAAECKVYEFGLY